MPLGAPSNRPSHYPSGRQGLPRFESTIERPVSVQGVGLHHGVSVKINLLPAAAGTGILFRRTDLNDFEIPASWRYVAKVSYATSLMRQGVLISTTEHLLSTLYSMGIDNCVIEIDNLEVPILDGSGRPFVEMLRTAGIKQLRKRRRYLKIRREITVETPGKRITIQPADNFALSCNIFFDHPMVGKQSIDLTVTPQNYSAALSGARTFGFAWELDQMRDMGLIRGATLENAVCFERDRVLNDGGLRYPDEPVRHKALDLIGDLALIGQPILGHVIADRAGHAMHAALVKQIMADSSLYQEVTADDLAAVVENPTAVVA